MTWQAVLLVCSIGIILVSIVPWRGFDPAGHWHRVGWIPYATRPARVVDVVGNLLLFMPLGASIALMFRRRALAWTAGLAFICSVVGEWAQVYSRYRYPSTGDVILNVGGATAAAYWVDLMRQWMMDVRGRAGVD